jgi:DNA replication and repair protein RecF
VISVEALRTRSFRNLADQELRLGEGVTLLWGRNGAGKTNLLEALYAALSGRSCRTRSERETIAFGQPFARAEVTVAAEGERREFTFFCGRSEGRRHLLNGSPAPPEAAAQRPSLAVFMPDRLALVKGPPAARRSHLDGFAAAMWPARAEARRRYARALAQRNALIARVRAGAARSDSLGAWDRELAAAGVELVRAREAAVGALAERFATAADELGLAEASLRYLPRSDAPDADALARELEERREADLARGYTTYGPHLDELALESAGRSLRRYGSQGQQRTALLALLFAERDALVDERRVPPLMLLDDVTSELDPERRELLCERLLRGGGQALITATDRSHLPESCPRLELAVRDGRALGSLEGEVEAA